MDNQIKQKQADCEDCFKLNAEIAIGNRMEKSWQKSLPVN